MDEEQKQIEEEVANGAIECRARVDIPATVSNEILFLPVGLHAITPVSGGIGRAIKVKIDQQSAVLLEAQRAAILARTDKRPYFDFNHEDGAASFWPNAFFWRTGEGVVAKGEWTASGKRAVEGKDFRAFSPVFHVDDKHKDPALIVCSDHASPNMGGLVNDPAFSTLPLWAKNAGNDPGPAGASSDQPKKEKRKMEEEAKDKDIATL